MRIRAIFLTIIFSAVLSLAGFAPALAQGTAPVADAGFDRTVAFDGINPVTVVLDGTRTTDTDGDKMTLSWSFVSIPASSVASLNDPAHIKPAFLLDQPGEYVIQLVANDGINGSAPDTVTISTDNSAPVARAGADRNITVVPAQTTVQLDGGGSWDVDGDRLSYAWTLVAAPPTSNAAISDPAAVRPTFVADVAGDYVAELMVSDGVRSSDPATVTFSTGNVAPLADAGSNLRAWPSGAPLLDAYRSSDANGDTVSYSWSIAWGDGGILNETARRPTMSCVASHGYCIAQLITSDGTVSSRPDTRTVFTGDANDPPIANAGPDRAVVAGDLVQLDASQSYDLNGGLPAYRVGGLLEFKLAFRWSLISAPAASLAAVSDPTAPRPSFTADLPGTYVVQLIASDGVEDSIPETVVISTDGNLPPVADAGPDQLDPNRTPTIQLNGSGSFDPDGTVPTYRWSLTERPDRSNAVLSDPAAANPTFVADKTGVYMAQLYVGDGVAESEADTVIVTAEGRLTAENNVRPVAVGGGAQTGLAPGTVVQLDASGTIDLENGPMTYLWALTVKPEGSSAAISDPVAIAPTFTVDVGGLYVTQLIVRDVHLYAEPPALVEIEANSPPVADAGPDQDGFVDQPVALDGTNSSDPDLNPLTYAWSFTAKPAGSLSTLTGAITATPDFTPDVFGDYELQLVVNDGFVDSAPDSVIVSMVNRAPVADAGDEQSVTAGALVQLDGSGSSDLDHQALTYAWRFTAKPAGSLAALSDAVLVNPTFTADIEGLYVLDLVVNDGLADSAPDTVGVRAGSGVVNTPPVLGAVGAQTVELGSALTVTLSATDADGDPFSFFATPLPLPTGAGLDVATGQFTFRPGADQVGVHTITFGASDGLDSDSESVSVTVAAPDPGTLTSLTGQLLDAVSSDAGLTVYVSGATVTIVGSGVTTTTDALGNFTLTSVPADNQLLSVDGSTAAAAPDGAAYGSLRQDVTLIADAINTLDGAVHLPRIDPNGVATYDPANLNPTDVINAVLGVTLKVAAQSATLNGVAYDGSISVSDMPPAEAAALLPWWVSPCQVISIQPFNLRFSGSVVLPNPDNLAAGAQVDIWGMHPDTGEFLVMGTGTVSGDGTQIVQTGGTIWAATLLMALPRLPNVALAEDMSGDSLNPSLLGAGNVSQAISLPGYTSLSEERAISLVYNSQAADAQPIVAANTTFVAGQALPPKLTGTLEVGGVAVAGPVYMDTAIAQGATPGISTGQAIRQALQFDAGAMPTGAFDYRYISTASYSCTKLSRAAHGRAVVNNQKDSAFGAGWTIPGLERLEVQADGSALITEGDGTAKVFDVNPTGQFFAPLGVPLGWPGAAALDDLDGDGNLDIAVPGMIPGNVVTLLGDGTGEFPIDRRFTAGAPRNAQNYPDTHTIATGDFNNDGIRDLVVNNQMSNRIRIYPGAGGGLFGSPTDIAVTRPQGLGVADFDLDGNDDIVVARSNSATGSTVKVFFGNGVGGFPATLTSPALAGYHVGVEIADFDNNGTPDAAIAAAKPGPLNAGNKIHLMRSDGARGFAYSTTNVDPIRWEIGRYPMAAADYNGDGNQDIAYGISGAINLKVLPGNGVGGFGAAIVVATGSEANSVRAADIDLDGDMDIVFSRRNGTLGVALGDGAGAFATASDIPVSTGTMFGMAVGDFNHDGAPDIQTGSAGENKVFTLMADPSGGGTFRSPGADFTTLTKNPDGTWVRRMTDGTTVEYNADGLMTARVDEHGNRTEYSYTDGLLNGISDPEDPTRSTSFDYSGGTLSSITEVSGRTTFFQVDANGDLVKLTDAGGNEWRYAYDANSKLSAFSSARGFVTSIDYGFAGQYLSTSNPDGTSVSASISGDLGLTDYESGLGTEATPEPSVAPEDRVATLTDARNNTYTMEVNEYGALIRVTDPIGRETRFVRDENNLVRQSVRSNDGLLPDGTAPATVTTNLDYDERGNTVSKTEAAGTVLERTTRFEYEPDFNRLVKVIDPSNSDPAPACATAGVTCMEYDPLNGDLLKVTDAKAGIQEFTYDPRGLRLTAVDANLNTTTFTYDFYGNIETSTNGAGDVTKMLRNAAGEVEGLTEGFGSPQARTTSYDFDDLGRVTFETSPDGGISETRYDADGNVIAEIDETGIAATSSYDEMGRLKSETHPATGTVTRLYDENGNMKSMIDPTGKIAHFQYDAVNRADRTEDPLAGIRLFAYDLQDKPKQVTDANGNPTYFKYDVHGREIERRNGLGDTWTFAYDSRDNMVETVDALGQTIDKSFDELSRLTGMTLTEADGLIVEDTVTFGYDAMGQKTGAVDGDSSLSWTYDGANRVATASTVAAVGTVQPAVVLTHGYDAAGNRSGLTHGPDGVTVDGAWGYLHDGDGNLTRVTMPTTETVDLAYDAASRLERITSANTVETQVLYDVLTGRPDSIAHAKGTTALESFDYGFDTDGMILSIADGGGTRNFTYDDTLQVTGGGYASAPESYAYDPEGNRTSSHLSASYTHDTANRLREDADTCYAYDANGNLASKRVKTGLDCVTDVSGATTTFEWDVLNRLARINFPDATYATYRYDAQGRRIEKDVNGTATRYVYDGNAILLEFGGANALQARYSHGEETDQPLAMTRSGDSYFYHTDHLGSVRLMTDASGNVANSYDYDSFGNIETSTGAVINPFTYTARERDAESGLMFYRARYYDPQIGRFISEDPIGFDGEDLNLYRYVYNDPILNVDPSGQSVGYGITVSRATRVQMYAGLILGVGGKRAAIALLRYLWPNAKDIIAQCVFGMVNAGGGGTGLEPSAGSIFGFLAYLLCFTYASRF